MIINRPFAQGELFAKVKGKALPAWAAEFDCDSWAQFFLKYIVAAACGHVRDSRHQQGAPYGR